VSAVRHPSATIEDGAVLGENVKVWHDVHIRTGAIVGDGVTLGKGAFIDTLAVVGPGCKIQNYACIYQGVTLEPFVFVGPHACFTNDHNPRAAGEWTVMKTHVEQHASIGANATIVCGVTIGRFAMVGAGSVVTRNVPAFAEVVGNPARVVGYVCLCGTKLQRHMSLVDAGYCHRCNLGVEGIRWERVLQ
jgi:UDP-2-acetamido-3-amino-2,3-dideoxy-glucuronate N-acetyltransferase